MVTSKFDLYLNSFDLTNTIQNDIPDQIAPVSILPDRTAASFDFRNEGQDAPSTNPALPCNLVRPLPDLSSSSQTQNQDQTLKPPSGPQDVSFPGVSNPEISDDQQDDLLRAALQRVCDERPFQERPREEGRNLSLPPVH